MKITESFPQKLHPSSSKLDEINFLGWKTRQILIRSHLLEQPDAGLSILRRHCSRTKRHYNTIFTVINSSDRVHGYWIKQE